MKGYSDWQWFSSLPWGKGKAFLQANLYFQNRLSMWNVSGATFNLGCKLIPHLSIAWEFSMLCTGIYFSDSQVCAVSSDSHATEGHWFQALWMLPFWSDGPEDGLHRGWEHNSVSCLGVVKLHYRAHKSAHLRVQIRQVCTPLNSFIRVCPRLHSAMSKARGYYLCTTGVNLVCQDLSGSCFQAPHSVCQWWSPADFLVPSVFSFLTAGTRALSTWSCAGLGEGP